MSEETCRFQIQNQDHVHDVGYGNLYPTGAGSKLLVGVESLTDAAVRE